MYLLFTILAILWKIIALGNCDGCGYPTILCCQNSNSSCKTYGPSISNPQSEYCFCDSYCSYNRDCCIDYYSICYGPVKPYLNFSVTFKGTHINLHLEINPDIPKKLPITVSDSRGSFTLPKISSIGVYNDHKNQASMVVKYYPSNQEPVPHPEMGSLIRNGQLYALYPAKSGSSSDVMIEGRQFRSEKEDLGDLVSISEKPGNINQFINSIYSNRRKRQSNLLKKNYNIELFILSDHSIHLKYKKWCDNPNEADKCGQQTNTNIENYIFLIINLVSLRYFSIINENFLIRIKTVSIQTSSSKDSISYIENEAVQNDSQNTTTINGTKALRRFALELNNNDSNFLTTFSGIIDHATLLTDYKIVIENLETQDIYAGNSIFDGMCKFDKNNLTRSISLVRNRGLFSVVAALSHQLAHSMRVLHDGDNNNCNIEDQYLMAPFIKNLTLSNADHINYFSKCSIDFLEKYFQGQNENFCLKIQNYPNIVKYTFPDNYTMDEYCMHTFGSKSRFCQGNYLDICYHMECWDWQKNVCVISDDVRAMDGMNCGFNKKCAAGFCQISNSDPIKPSQSVNPCYFDDYIANFTWGFYSNFYCADISLANVNACYNDTVQKRCCKTCNKLQCQDKENWCVWYASLSNCNVETDSSVRDACCYTCQKINTPTTPFRQTPIITVGTPVIASTLTYTTRKILIGTPAPTTYLTSYIGTTRYIGTTPPFSSYSCQNGDIWGDWCVKYADKTRCQNSDTRINCCVTCSKYF